MRDAPWIERPTYYDGSEGRNGRAYEEDEEDEEDYDYEEIDD